MNKSEYWIKIGSNDKAEEIQRFITSLEPELLGEIPVILFNYNTRAVRRLSHVYDLHSSALNVLKEQYGDLNVKYTEKEWADSERTEQESLFSLLERIASSLEGIELSLRVLEDLSNGVDIAGSVTTYEG